MSYPIKFSLKSEIIPILTVIASFVIGAYFYIHFPAVVINHWNFEGQPNGYGSRLTTALGIPLLLLGMYVLFLVLPALDPKKDRYEDFAKVYHIFKAVILFVLLIIFIATGLYNLGYPVNINLVIPTLIGAMMIVMGNFMGKIKNNWFIGIRTPWTLSSENVWNSTHRFGGRMFVLFGIILILTPLLPKSFSLPVFILGLLLVTVGTFFYSYLAFKKEQAEKLM